MSDYFHDLFLLLTHARTDAFLETQGTDGPALMSWLFSAEMLIIN